MSQATIVNGMGPDTPTYANENGGRQSDIPFACHLLPASALLSVARILKDGADKYGPDNWRSIPRHEHLNHCLAHVLAHLAGDSSDDHLGHAATRLLFALETE